MTDLTTVSVVCTAEAGLRKLKRGGIPVYNCKKEGAKLLFSVKDKDLQKVFAIFDNPCYNVTVKKPSLFKRLLNAVTLRAGLAAGAAAFIIAAAVSNSFVLKIEVGGTGSYLEHEILRIAEDEGAGTFKPFSAFNVSVATGRILALPQVTFCNIEKRGSVLFIDVQTDEEHYGVIDLKPLVSDRDGVIRNIVAVCGTATAKAGDGVKKSSVLIDTYTYAGEEKVTCLAVGYAELECSGTVEYFATEESEENLKNALSAALLEADELISRKYTVKPTEGGIVYVIDFTYLHKISINLN